MKWIALLLLGLPHVAAAQAAFEEPPVLNASQILRPEYLSGAGWKVQEVVPTYAGRNSYTIESDFGEFYAEGNAMLVRRVREVEAIRRLREVSKSDEYKEALKKAATSPLMTAKGLIEHPVKTVTGVPKGLFKMFHRAGEGIKGAAEGRERNPYEDSTGQQMIGFSKAKREVAAKLGVDPYTSNEMLQKELNGHSWTSFAGSMTVTAATLPIGGGLGTALTATNVTGAFNDALRDKTPTDLRLMNQKTLDSLGIPKALIEEFLGHPAYSPSAQTALVMHLNQLRGVNDLAVYLRLATGNAEDEADALFFCETARVLATVHSKDIPLAGIGAFKSFPVARAKDGSAVLALEWDYATWTQRAADFITQWKSQPVQGQNPTGYSVVISGIASPMATEMLQKAGIQLYSRISAGPLK